MTKTEYQQFLNDVLFGVQGYEKEIQLAESAHELLEACKIALNSRGYSPYEVADKLSQAISKAEGKV